MTKTVARVTFIDAKDDIGTTSVGFVIETSKAIIEGVEDTLNTESASITNESAASIYNTR